MKWLLVNSNSTALISVAIKAHQQIKIFDLVLQQWKFSFRYTNDTISINFTNTLWFVIMWITISRSSEKQEVTYNLDFAMFFYTSSVVSSVYFLSICFLNSHSIAIRQSCFRHDIIILFFIPWTMFSSSGRIFSFSEVMKLMKNVEINGSGEQY